MQIYAGIFIKKLTNLMLRQDQFEVNVFICAPWVSINDSKVYKRGLNMKLEVASKAAGIFAVIAPIIWGGITYTIGLKNEQASENFANFHNLIAEIYDGGRRGYVGSQRALIFELGNFPDYYEFTCRELPRMKNQLSNKETLNEIEYLAQKIQCKGG